jgi:hypothetical protein
MSAIDELLDERYWEPDRSFTPQVWTYIGEEDPREAAAELAALRAEVDRYDRVCTEVRNSLTSFGIPELTGDRLTVIPLVERVRLLQTLRQKGINSLRAELAAANKAVDEARELLNKTEWVRFDRSVFRNYCWRCDHLQGEHYPECELSAWLTAHPAQKEQE